MLSLSRGLLRPKFSDSALGPSAVNSTIVTSTDNISNDGVAKAIISGVVKGISSGVLSGVTVVITGTGSGNTYVQSSVTNSLGEWNAEFKSTGASAHVISAVANGITLSGTVTVTAVSSNAPDATKCLVSSDDSIIALGETCVLTLQAKDSGDNNITVGGATVVFSKASGSIGLSFGTVTDVGNGTYTCVVTCTGGGSVGQIATTINSSTVTTTQPTISRPASLFQSAWSNSLGTGSTALKDGTTWPNVGSSANIQVVIDPDGSPIAINALRLTRSITKHDSVYVNASSIWTSPAGIGDVLYKRWYTRFGITVAEAVDDKHPVQTQNQAGACLKGVVWNLRPSGSSKWRLIGNIKQGTFPAGFCSSSPSSGTENLLDIDRWYRVEEKYVKTAANTYDIYIRVYDDTNTLIWTDANIRWQGLTYPLMSADRNRTVADSDTQGDLSKWQFGSNGGTWANVSDEYFWFTAVCVRSDDWCGPYNSLDG